MTRTFTPRHSRVLVDFILSKRVRQSLVRTFYPWRDKRFSRTLPPTFLFLQYSIFKEQTPQTQCRGPFRFWLRGRPSVAYAALLNLTTGRLRSKLLRRQRRAALVGEAYIVATFNNCQQPRSPFFRFLVEISPRPEFVSWLAPIVTGFPVQLIPLKHATRSAPSGCHRPEIAGLAGRRAMAAPCLSAG